MKISIQKLLLSLILLSAFVGCDQDPYPIDPNAGGSLRLEPIPDPQEPDDVLPELSLSVDDVIEYKEGRSRDYLVRAAVAEPGKPIVKIDNLPAGAEFDPKTFILKWRPGFFDGNDANDPTIKSQIYPVTIWLRSTENERKATRKKVNLVVFDVPQRIGISYTRNNTAQEGKEWTSTFTIDNPDYPLGPFKVISEGLPANTELQKVDEVTYKFIFKPDHFHVNRKIDGRELRYKGKIIVANPANHIEETEFNLTVKDVRKETELVVPSETTQGLDLSFQVSAFDLNKEVPPSLELVGDGPGFGKFSFETVQSNDSFSTVLLVKWNDIPPARNREFVDLRFKACVLGESQTNMNNCKTKTTRINILVRNRTPPFISRANWKAGELVYLGFNEVLTRRVPIRDREDPNLSPEVKVFPVEMRKYVKWNGDRLRLKFDKPGVFQFNLRAKSEYNMSSSESFIVEVFPENRKRTLLFADSTRDPEVVFYKTTFNNMDIMNPAIQRVSQRNVSDRDTLVVTTSTLLDKSNQAVVMEAIEKIKNVVIATPLILNLPEKLLADLERWDLKPLGRYSQLPNLPPLATMNVVTNSQFAPATDKVLLKGSASKESKDPMIFAGGLFDSTLNCKPVIGISSNGSLPLAIGAACDRDNGGRMVVLGTEWADLQVSEVDKLIPNKWFNTMLKTQF